ncbi:nucleic acid binding protein, partial [Trifolium pratense]
CQGGDTVEKSLSIYIPPDGGSAAWVCFRGKCGWKGSTQAFAGSSSSYSTAMNQLIPAKKKRQLNEEDLQLEPLCNEKKGFFSTGVILPLLADGLEIFDFLNN